jgi:microcin C transport system permease protein
LLIILISIFEPGILLLVFISAIFGWVSISYYMRAEALKLRKMEFIEASRAMGLTNWKIIMRHLLPNSLTPLITFSPFAIAGNITGLTALDFLGFGLSPPTPSWGELMAQATKYFSTAWWLAFYPSLALFVTLALFNFAFDPKS